MELILKEKNVERIKSKKHEMFMFLLKVFKESNLLLKDPNLKKIFIKRCLSNQNINAFLLSRKFTLKEENF